MSKARSAKHIRFWNKIDWALLREQKACLLRWTEDRQDEETKYSQGLLELLDALQDHAVDVLGIPEETVFGKLKDE